MKKSSNPKYENAKQIEDSTIIMEYIASVAKIYQNTMKRQCEKLGIQSAYYRIISILSKKDGIAQLELVKVTGYKAPTISITLQKMQSEGYITRRTDIFDQRSVRVHLTERGRDIYRRISVSLKETEHELLANFDEEDLALLKTLLAKFQNAIEPQDAEAESEE
ncbi:MAG: winged helix-turn-helix transcriptional regulator [Oscillospiraceae bacterium]|nr:winged helix-turn-helix transcriptional regulator [Oscillospiraceae bacterium]